MKNTVLACILVSLGICFLGLQTSWWLSPIWTVLVLMFVRIGIMKSILVGALSFGLIWLAVSLYWFRLDETDMIGRTSAILGGISSIALLFVTFFVGLVTGGLSGWLGGALGAFLKNRNTAQQHG